MLAGTYRFVLAFPYLCFFWIWKLYRKNLNLLCFTIKKKKKLRAKVKRTTLFKNTRPNSEVQKQRTEKHTKRIEITNQKHKP